MIKPTDVNIRSSSISFSFIWNRIAVRKINKRMIEAQAYIDTECIDKMTPLVPVAKPRFYNAGKLRDSVEIKEPGCIIYTAPFAKHDYYSAVNHQHGGNKKAQRMWFEPMKRQCKTVILRGAAAIVGGRAK